MSKIPEKLQAKWKEISTKPYAAQCRWMLNGFWPKMGNDAELVWGWSLKFVELDQGKRHDGCDLDEFWSHKFLETLGETMTVIQMREEFRKIDADFNKRMSMIEWLAYRYKLTPEDVINAPQGDNTAGIARAQKLVDEAQKLMEVMSTKFEASKKATAAAKEATVKAHAAAAEAKKTAEAAWYAEQEQKKAVDEVRAQEKAYEDKKASLRAVKDDANAGVVRRNKAANELEQLMSEDPLPLRKAKITQESALKKCEKARAAAESAKVTSEQRAADAEKAKKDAEVAEQEAEAAVKSAEAKLQEALNVLEEEKGKGGVARGDIWWLEREVAEKRKYLPANKRC